MIVPIYILYGYTQTKNKILHIIVILYFDRISVSSPAADDRTLHVHPPTSKSFTPPFARHNHYAPSSRLS